MSLADHPDTEDVYGEKSAFADLLLWSADRPAWQRDALRRLVQNGTLSAEELDQLVSICLDPTLTHDPVSQVHISAQATDGAPIALLRIENATGVNALAKGQKLEFAKSGLTIIYGDNGSGKSGYVRVLKHACRTRDRGQEILRDIEDSAATPQKADIVFTRGAVEQTFGWTPDIEGHPDLPSVSIFDSRSANIHVEETNAVAYIPQPMQIMESLASTCDRIKAKLEQRLQALADKTPLGLRAPQLRKDTAAGTFAWNLSSKSNLAQLDILAHLTDAEKQRLASLETDLAQDPQRAAARILNQKNRLDDGIAKLKRLRDASSNAAFAERDTLKLDWDQKSAAAKLASDGLFAASPLPDVGKAIWQNLWEAARKYSDTVAYPGRAFPHQTEANELCVLCQQPLEHAANERQVTFETFVKGSTKADDDRAKAAYEATMARRSAAKVKIKEIRQLRDLLATEIGDASLAAAVHRSSVLAALRLRLLLRDQPPVVAEEAMAEAALVSASTSLGVRASQLSADQNSAEHIALVREFRELKDREALAPLVPDIKAEVGRLLEAAAIAAAIKDTAKRSVTTKNKELSDKLVTNALRGRFSREIAKLKLSRMPVELRKIKDKDAVSYFQVCLVEKPSESVGEIFSEGEHRCVALAAFLAELVTSKQYSSIVFDDPMSSLDHIHRKAVAARLIEEAAHRQVIVFTHDLTFLFELRREAEAKESLVHYQTVSRKQAGPGYVAAELPVKAKTAPQRASALRTELKDAKGMIDSWSETRRTVFFKGVIEQLREAWDQGIADFVFPVLGRFENAIKGGSLYKLAVLSEEDVKTVTAARSRLSDELHATADTLNPETVTLDILGAEVTKFETWLTDITRRQGLAKKPATSFT